MAGDASERYFVVGGAGFIGSHFVHRLLSSDAVAGVTVYDNFSSGRDWHLADHDHDPRLAVVAAEIDDTAKLAQAMAGHQVVIHLASNPDIARAATDPEIDFRAGTALTQKVVEAMRKTGVARILYASGSGIYGELGEIEAHEDFGPLIPISTYGASKLAGETLIASYCHMFGLSGRAFRFGNVVGARQTHGVGLDFLRRLVADPARLSILGDGWQSKSYVHVSDVVGAVLHIDRTTRFAPAYQVYNVATLDYVTVREIAAMAIAALGLEAGAVALAFSGGDRGWKGDVPIVRLNSQRLRASGWGNRYTAKQAIRQSLEEMLADVRGGRL
ncbi:MAG TPA: NAD-dependent epimerase/dehydratase family protein [Caulobacteraceae bacterium]|nr:NAD-dependent epimerase/dehydratase family protein [Caulobacteraceae bacterium]